LSSPALAAPAAIHVADPVIRVASPVSKTGAGYMVIMNHGGVPDQLIAVETTAASRADLHGTSNVGGIMRMRAQAGGVPIPAGGSVRFASGGLHVMFIGLKGPVPDGSVVKARLRFARAGAIAVNFKAQSIAAQTHQP
jgi:copper(I)-binding protein